MRAHRVAVLALLAVSAAGCPEKHAAPTPSPGNVVPTPEPGRPVAIGRVPPPRPNDGAPPVGVYEYVKPSAQQQVPAETGVDLPLALSGVASRAQLDSELSRLDEAGWKQPFERAYRLVFTVKQELRSRGEARSLVAALIAKKPGFAPAYRVLAEASIQDGGIQEAALLYGKALSADAGYAPAHYGLATVLPVLIPPRLEEGREHFQRALALGVADERDLKAKHYGASKP